MFDNRDLKTDLLAVLLCAVVLFLAVALLTYDPADQLQQVVFPLNKVYHADVLVHPATEAIHNRCGRLGALTANVLFNGLGIGAYFLTASAAVLTYLLLVRRTITMPLVRLTGWLASLFGVVTIVAMLAPGLSPGPVIGAGGYLGALGRAMLATHFATTGGLILAVSVTFGGLLLCTDYVLLHAVWAVVATTGAGAGRLVRRRSGDDEQADEQGARGNRPAVRIRGKQVDLVTDIDDEEEPWEEEEEEEVEQDELEQDEGAEEAEEEPEEEEEEEEVAVRLPRSRGRLAALVGRGKRRTKEHEQVMEQLDEASRQDESNEYELPSIDLLLTPDEFSYEEQEKEVRQKARIIERTFESFGFAVRVVEIETGPVIAQYEVELEAGLRLSRITGLADDLAIALRVPTVRIVAPIPGKNTVGIEVPNEQRQVVRLREVMEESSDRTRKMRIPLFLGKDVSGNPLSVDLSTLPHLLIAGRTGTGKSVCLNAIIGSILMTRRPDEVRMLMIDPKMVELSGYKSLPHLMHPVVTDMRKAEAILAWAVEKMEQRYELLANAGVRQLSVYNQLGEEELLERLQPETDEDRAAIPLHLPYIVIVADELADLMMTSGKEVEQHIIRLAQKSRAVGIHLILATQKPTVDVITGLIKSNLPARISFQVASRTDSRVVLDEMGADRLLGNGDMLFLWPGTSTLLRGQGTYMSDDEINGIVDAASTGEQHFVKELVQLKVEEAPAEAGELKKRDDLYEAAVDVVVREGRGSVSLLQRALGIGYGRAARLIDFMAEDGIVGAYAGSQAREVTISVDEWRRMQGEEVEEETAPSPPRRRSNKIIPYQEEPAEVAEDAPADIVDDEPEWEEDESQDDELVAEDDAEYEEDELEEEPEEDDEEYEYEEEDEYDEEEYDEDDGEWDEEDEQPAEEDEPLKAERA